MESQVFTMLKVALVVVSTSRSKDTDLVAPKVQPLLPLTKALIVKDSVELLRDTLIKLGEESLDIIIFAGGTGLTSDDVTPEAISPLYERKLPGFDEAMRMESFKKTPFAILSRAESGIYKKKIILQLPGSPKAVAECLEVIMPVLKHAVEKIQDNKQSCSENKL